MNIIWETPTDEMHERYLILELEPHNIEGEMKDTWCVIEADRALEETAQRLCTSKQKQGC